MKVIEYLKEEFSKGYTNEEVFHNLSESFSISVNRYEQDGLVILNYDQIHSPKDHPIVMECRSLVLEDRYPFSLVSKKFDRFFNLGENLEYQKDVDLSRCKVYEKVDGSLMGIFKYQDKVYLSTKSMIYAEGCFTSEKTFRQLAFEAAGIRSEEHFQNLFDYLEEGQTLVFELIHQENRVVTPYDKNEWVLLSFNDRGQGFSYGFLKSQALIFKQQGLSVRVVKKYDSVKDQDELFKMMESSLSGLDEGFVVHDEETGKRLKIKRSEYITAHKLRGENREPSNKDLLKLIVENEQDEFLTYFPVYKERVDKMLNTIWGMLRTLDREAKELGYDNQMISQKEYASKAKDVSMNHFLFMARKHQKYPSEIYVEMNADERFRNIKMLFGV